MKKSSVVEGRFEFLLETVACMNRSEDFEAGCRWLLHRRRPYLQITQPMTDKDLLLMAGAIAQVELIATRLTSLPVTDLPRTPAQAATYFLNVANLIERQTGREAWTLIMWAALTPFRRDRQPIGSA